MDQSEIADEVELRLAGQTARIWSRGATLRSYRVHDRDVIVPFAPGQVTGGMHGAILAPWPNRLADGRFEFAGHTYQVPVNEIDRQNAIHGLVADRTWTLTHSEPDHAHWQISLDPLEYGFAVDIGVDYRLGPDGLTVQASAFNRGEEPAPFGIGFHPWLSPGNARIDECDVRADVSAWLECDDRLIPIRETDIPAPLDFRRPRMLGGTILDDCFVAEHDVQGKSVVSLLSPDGFIAEISSDSELPYWQLCTGDFDELGDLKRSGVAAEPMSCPANGLASGQGLVVIEPHTQFCVEWTLRLRPQS